jgi:undecaprenyl diphosphate synthase
MNELNHVAIIMDGNGRWGLKKKRSRNYGHLKGLKAVENVIKSSINKQIPYLTLYTFSTENWKRPEKEINFLFDLIRKYIKKNLNKIIKRGIKFNVIGVKKKLPSDIIKNIKIIEKKTLNNKKITINLALNYGSKEEIISACKKFLLTKNKKLDVNNFQDMLYTKNIPDPDILIRTGGTRRLSNFLLWQLAYSELFFVDKMWPEFNDTDYSNIIKKFKQTKRNFGSL